MNIKMCKFDPPQIFCFGFRFFEAPGLNLQTNDENQRSPQKDLQFLDSGVGGDDDADDSDMGCDCDILR